MTHQDFRNWVIDEQEKQEQETYDRGQRSERRGFNSFGNVLQNVMKDIHEMQKAQARAFANAEKVQPDMFDYKYTFNHLEKPDGEDK